MGVGILVYELQKLLKSLIAKPEQTLAVMDAIEAITASLTCRCTSH